MKAKVKATQQVVEVTCTDVHNDYRLSTWEDANGGKYLEQDIDFEDLCDYKTWVEDLIHDLAVAEFNRDIVECDNRQQIANNIVLFAYAVMDRMQQESKTWR